MDDPRFCPVCRADLAGPFQPQIALTHSPDDEKAGRAPVNVAAQAWICAGCGLVHWYARDEDFDKLLALTQMVEEPGSEAETSYERRAQMLRMLRKVKRM